MSNKITDSVTELDKSINDRDIIVTLVNLFMSKPKYDDESVKLMIARSLVYFEEIGLYPDTRTLCAIQHKLECEVFEKRF